MAIVSPTRKTGSVATGELSAFVRRGGSYLSVTGGTCPGTSLEPGQSCSVDVQLQAPSDGRFYDSLAVFAEPGGYATVEIAAHVLPPDPLSVTPESIDFGDVPAGSLSTEVEVVVANVFGGSGGTAAPNLVVEVTSSVAPQAFLTSADSCSGATLAPDGGQCTIRVRFHPETVAFLTGRMTVSAPGKSGQVSLAGTGTAP